jgi:hypothetical protein
MSPHSTTVETETLIEQDATSDPVLRPKSVPENHKAPLRTIFPPLQLEEHPIDEARPLKAIVVGAGMSGIIAGILLPKKVPGLELQIIERNSNAVSLTWSSLSKNIKP